MATDVDTPTPETPVAPSESHGRLFRFSAWLHVGDGAEECAERETGNCEDGAHFHGWCRLPNKLQQRDIREHALAAKARKVRQLRDPELSGHEILEGELDAIARLGDSAKEELILELLSSEWATDYLAALAEVNTQITDEGDDDEQMVWGHIDADKKRWEELQLAIADHPQLAETDEYKELEGRLVKYQDAIEAAFEAIRLPRREALEPLDVNALLDKVRDLRIDAQAQEEFLHTYSLWEWTTCTRRAEGGWPRWKEPTELTELPDEVLAGLQATYDDLEKAQKEAASPGNS